MNQKNSVIELSVSYNSRLSEKLKGQIILIKFGGNAMTNDDTKQVVIDDIIALKKIGAIPVIVHGGGPVIKELLNQAGTESEFIEGHRKTDAEAMRYVEMALSGSVNSDLVTLINRSDFKAVGLSGKDGRMVTAIKRWHKYIEDGNSREADLGFVGDVETVNPELIHTLIKANYIPVISPVSMDKKGDTYNINADMFAGHMAGALNTAHYVALTDVDGLLSDKNDSSTLVHTISLEKTASEIGDLIQGGMIPKTESCIIALKTGVQSAHIINGMTPHSLLQELLTEKRSGTLIHH